MIKLIKTYTLKLGHHKDQSRVFIESKKIEDTSLSNLLCDVKYDTKLKQITLTPGTQKKLTKRKNEKIVVDINNKTVTDMFRGYEHITAKICNDRIIIEPLREEILQSKAKAKSKAFNPTAIEVFAGGGTLIRSLKDAGITTKLAIDLEDKYLENTEANNPSVPTYCTDLSKLDFGILPDADIVSGGIPCEGYSTGGKQTKEDHPTGSLGFYFLKIVDLVRPSLVLIEEVPNFKTSAMASMARYVLKSMGYHISEKMLIGTDYGSLTKRKRYCMIGTIDKPFIFQEPVTKCSRTVNDILEIPMEDREWLDAENSATIAYIIDAELEHIRKGNSFRIARTSPDDSGDVATITKGYYKHRLTDPILEHPDKPNTFSWLTPRELARINGLPEDFILPNGPMDKSKAGEIIGQGVCYEAFNHIGSEIMNHFRS